MMNNFIGRVFLIAAFASLIGCNKKPADTQPESEAVLAVLRANMDCLNREDVNACTALMHPSSPGIDQTKKMSEKLFATYDLRFTLKDMAVESVGADEAKVRFDQLTEKIAGPEFRNNRTHGIHTLRKHDGQWKLYSTQITNVQYIDK